LSLKIGLLGDTTLALEKKPTMPLNIFRPVSSSGRTLFNLRKYRCPRRFRALKMRIEVVYVDKNPINNPRSR
jgi:hypothetical protein